MAGNERTILLVAPLIAAVVAFWFLALSPKQDEVKKLDSQISSLQSDVAEQQQAAQAGLQARKDFPRDYQHLVVMGKAVPVDDETPSLLVQINRIADAAGASFMAISQSSGSASTATAAAPTPIAPATESAASLLPIGATVGSAGLPVLPYELTFSGNYFEIADFMAGIDRLVKPRKGTIAADGRLVTIDGFTLTIEEATAVPVLNATMTVTTYVTPADVGLTAGATPTGPSTVTPSTTPASATTTPSP